LSAIYFSDGKFRGVELYPLNPALVIVDTRIAAEAPVRFIVSGMGDAMATWYEARTCFQNPRGKAILGTRPTIASVAIAELCADTLYDHGVKAIEAVRGSLVNESVERVVEANTLMSGIGFESCGVAAAHCIAQGLTVIPSIHKNYLHGEMVAIGLMTHLVLEGKEDEARKVGTFFAEVGLPLHLAQISQDPARDMETLHTICKAAVELPFIHNEPFDVSEETLLNAMLKADRLGLEIADSVGDVSYIALHGK
jgi:glycerol dehydrogenase